MDQIVTVALYCRVSTDMQEKERTIQSQLEALRKYAAERQYEIAREFLDEGYSGATLERPGLDHLRDALVSGDFQVVLIHSPDRLARKAVYQSLVIEEMERAQVKVEFLNHPVDDTPEGKMLLGMQGLFAEYERAKIAERNRRGKIYWARQGVFVGGRIPYGYQLVHRDHANGQRASLEVNEAEATTVRDMYRWLLEEQLSCRAMARRLVELEVPTQRGTRWRPSTVNTLLHSEAYKGIFHYRSSKDEWVPIPVPAIVDEGTWEAAQRQLHQNALYARRNNKHYSYLLRGLIRCPRCGATCIGVYSNGRRNYRCNQLDYLSAKNGKRCGGGWVKADPVENAVWDAVTGALKRPEVLMEEYRRRIKDHEASDTLDSERKQIEIALKQVKKKQDRITDAYMNEALEIGDYKGKMDELRQRKSQLEAQLANLDKRATQQLQEKEALSHLQSFCETVSQGLDNLSFEEKQQLLRLVVERIVVNSGTVHIEAIIPLSNVNLCPECENNRTNQGVPRG
uniref:Putative invertase n=1 Tax=bacterium enrichment culture clone fosmid MGS-K1 TaxID=1549356 RepID=A0A0B5KH99_9BACT|nr:putative invertase [bacterium enrichment culture clone fosmid MGS-K1]